MSANKIVPATSSAALASMTDDELKRAIISELELTVKSIYRMAEYYREFDRRGTLPAELRQGMGKFIAAVAMNRLAPEIVVKFLGEDAKLNSLIGLPLARQLELANGGTVKVYDREKKAAVNMTLERLPRETLKYVFRDGRELPIEEQRVIVKPVVCGKGRMARTVQVDRPNNLIRIGKTQVKIPTVVAALAESAGCNGKIDLNQHARDSRGNRTVPLTDQECERIDAAAKAAGLSSVEWMRRALFAFLA